MLACESVNNKLCNGCQHDVLLYECDVFPCASEVMNDDEVYKAVDEYVLSLILA